MLAALTLLGVTVWLWQTRRAAWVWLVTGLPMLWMYVMSVWALAEYILPALEGGGIPTNPVTWVAVLLVFLAVMVLIEAVRAIVASLSRPGLPPDPAGVPAG